MIRSSNWRADCPKCVTSKFTCDEHFAESANCPSSPDGRHQVDTSMESRPYNCFYCERPMR